MTARENVVDFVVIGFGFTLISLVLKVAHYICTNHKAKWAKPVQSSIAFHTQLKTVLTGSHDTYRCAQYRHCQDQAANLDRSGLGDICCLFAV